MRLEPLALRRPIRLVVIIVEPAFTDSDHARMRRCLDQYRRAQVGMCIRLMGMNPNTGPNVGMTLGGSYDLAPLLLAGGNVEETVHATRPRRRQHFLLPLGETFIIEVAMAID